MKLEQKINNDIKYAESVKEYQIKKEHLSWFEEPANQYMPMMETDISITALEPPKERLVIDTKYYKKPMQRAYRGESWKFHSEKLYQIYAYLRTQEGRGENYANARGMLLYPTLAHPVDEVLKVQAHTIRVATIDLADPWERIEEHLLSYV